MKIVLAHYVSMQKYEVPDDIAKQGSAVVENYIIENDIAPFDVDSRDWEVVDIQD